VSVRSGALLIATALGASACGATIERRAEPEPPRDWTAAVDDVSLSAEPEVWDGRTGEPLTLEAVRARLGAVDVVLVGERHGDRDYHLTQAQVLLVARGVGFTTVGVEWLPWHRRTAVRAAAAHPTLRDKLSALYVDLDWPRTWGHDFAAYVPALAFALEHMVLEPLNARRELSSVVARGGREAVPEDLKGELPPLDSGTEAHRRWFAELMQGAGAHGGHGHALGPEALERYYLAQLVWDESMALRVRELARGGKVVVLAGLGHTERGLGIAARLGDRPWLVVRPVADATEARARARDAAYPERDADLLWAFPRTITRASAR